MLYSQTISAIILAIAPAVLGHSWIEQIMVIGEDGSLPQAAGDLKIGESQPVGFPRNNSLRAASFDENSMVHKILEVSDKAPICGPSQSKPFQSADSPILKASPGDMVALLYQENGHVTISPDAAGTGFMPLKAKGSGTVFIYGTTDPKPDDKLFSIWKKWNADGSGGDKRGFLLATRDYDDGQCHQDNMGKIASERRAKQNSDMTLFCQNDFTIPDTAKPGSLLTVYWVWQWDNMKAPEFTETQNVEMYTTCMDIEIVEGKGTSKNLKFNEATPIHKRAIKEQLTNSFTSSNPVEGTTGGQSPKLPGPIPDQANGKERLPADGSSPAPVADAPAKPKPEQKPSPSAQPSVPVPFQSDAPKATVTVTVEKPGPAQFVTITETESILVGVTVGQSLTLGKKPDTPATSGAASLTASDSASPSIPTTLATVASSAASSSASSTRASQASASAVAGGAGGAGGARPVVEGFLDAEASIIIPTPSPAPPSSPSSISAPTLSVVADITTASPPVPATTSAPAPSPVEEPLQIITEEATITEYETIVTSFVKPSSTESAQPTLEAPAGVNNGTVAARAAKELPRFRRLRRAL